MNAEQVLAARADAARWRAKWEAALCRLDEDAVRIITYHADLGAARAEVERLRRAVAVAYGMGRDDEAAGLPARDFRNVPEATP